MTASFRRLAAQREGRRSTGASGLRTVLTNLAHLLVGKAAAGIMSLIYLAIVARTLGVERYGVLMLVNGYVAALGSLVAFSGFHGVVRYGSIALEMRRPDQLARIVRFMAVVELAFGLAAWAIALLGVPLVGARLGWSADAQHIAMFYSLAVFSTVRATPQGLLQIDRRYDLVGLQQAVSPLVRLIGTSAVWLAGGGLDAFLLVWFLSSLAEGVSMWLLAWPSWRKLAAGERLRGPWRGVSREIQGFIRFGLITNLDITLRELAPNLAPLTVGWMLGPAAAGLFSLAQKTTAILQQPAVLLGQASYSVLAAQVAQGRIDRLRRTVWRSTALAAAVGAGFVLALGLVGGPMMKLLGGRTFSGGAILVGLLAAGRAAALAASPMITGLTALGRPQRAMAVTLFTGLALYPLLPLLIWWLGLDGSGWHGFAQSIVAALMLLFLFARDAQAAAHPPEPRIKGRLRRGSEPPCDSLAQPTEG